jgi:hypothetical protein
MESDDGFRSFADAIDSDLFDVLLAKVRRDAFIEKLKKLPDVVEVIPSGSFTRGTQIGPVHDVDLIVVFDSLKHPDYGSGQQSAQGALEHLQKGLVEQLHPLTGEEGLVKDTKLGSHVVKCYSDVPRPFADVIPSAPPVDVMPAVREGFHLKVPERGNGWIATDPEKLIRQVERRQREWKYFTEVVQMVKAWAERNHLGMKNLAIDMMVLKYCPRPRLFETLSCGEAIARFFKAAEADIGRRISPPEWLRKIDRDIGAKYAKLGGALGRAAEISRKAMDAERALENPFLATGEVTDPDEYWRDLFGSKYPRAGKRFFRAPETEPWWGGRQRHRGNRGPDDLGGHWPDGPDRGPEGPNLGPEGPDRGPEGPNRGPEGPNRGPEGPAHGPGDVPGWRPSGSPPDQPGGPSHRGGAHRYPGHHRKRASAEPGTNLWTGIFASTGAVSVPLTFG